MPPAPLSGSNPAQLVAPAQTHLRPSLRFTCHRYTREGEPRDGLLSFGSVDTDRATGAESTRRREGQDGAGQRVEGPRSGAHRVPPSPGVPKEPPRFRGHRAAPRALGASLTAPRPASLGFLRRARQDGEGGRPWGRDGQRAVKQAAPGRRSPRPCPSGRSVPWRRRKAQLAGPGRSRLLRPPQEVPGGRPR